MFMEYKQTFQGSWKDLEIADCKFWSWNTGLSYLSRGPTKKNSTGDPPSGRTTGVFKVELFPGFSF